MPFVWCGVNESTGQNLSCTPVSNSFHRWPDVNVIFVADKQPRQILPFSRWCAHSAMPTFSFTWVNSFLDRWQNKRLLYEVCNFTSVPCGDRSHYVNHLHVLPFELSMVARDILGSKAKRGINLVSFLDGTALLMLCCVDYREDFRGKTLIDHSVHTAWPLHSSGNDHWASSLGPQTWPFLFPIHTRRPLCLSHSLIFYPSMSSISLSLVLADEIGIMTWWNQSRELWSKHIAGIKHHDDQMQVAQILM